MMYLAAKHEAETVVSKIIQAWTFSRYCHTELIFSNGQWFSAREGEGVSFITPDKSDYADYDIFPIPLDEAAEARIRKWCGQESYNDNGTKCGYDYRGVIFSFLPIPIGWQSPKDWFCSEICVAALQTEGWFAGYSACSISPGKCVELYRKEYYRRMGRKS